MGGRKPGSNRRELPPSQRTERHHADADNLVYLAVHEAGHSVAAVVLGLELSRVTLTSDTLEDGTNIGGFAGMQSASEVDLVGLGGNAVLPYLVLTFAGPQAEACVNSQALAPGGHAQMDFQMADRIARRAVCKGSWQENGQYVIPPDEYERCQQEVDKLIELAASQTKELIDRHSAAVEKVARLLYERKSIDGSEVAAIVAAESKQR